MTYAVGTDMHTANKGLHGCCGAARVTHEVNKCCEGLWLHRMTNLQDYDGVMCSCRSTSTMFCHCDAAVSVPPAGA